MPGNQFGQNLGLVASGIHLFEPKHCRYVGNAPGVSMEHGGQRRINVQGVQARGARVGGHREAHHEDVQDDLLNE